MSLSLRERIIRALEELTEDQQQQLWEILQAFRKDRGGRAEGDPELYVELDQDSLSFEIPPDRLIAVLCRWAEILQPQRLRMRFAQRGRRIDVSLSPSHLKEALEEHDEILREGIVVLEYGRDTLYSNGGGCLLWKTSAEEEVKKQLARSALEICGFPHEVSSQRFKALVRDNRLKILEP